MLKYIKPYIKLIFGQLTFVFALLIIAQSAMAQQALNYDEAIIYGDRKLKEASFQDAKAYYQMALRFKPDDAYSKEKISEIIAKMQAKMESEDAYYDFIDKADELFEGGKLNMAIIQYQKALEVIPGDEYAAGQVTKIITFQAKEKEKLEHYDQLMKSSAALVSNKSYDEAMAQLIEAQSIFPANSEPGEQLALAKTLKADWVDKQQRCAEKMEEASRYILINNYVTSLELYEEALSIIPDQQEALDKVKEIKPLAEKQKKYNWQVEKADESYVNKDFIAAQKEYEVAKALWPEKTYAADMLAKIQEQLADQMKDLDKNYTLFIRRGDSLYDVQAYSEAKGEFGLALNLKPNESYPKSKLAAIDAYFADQRKAFEANYGQMVASADSAFNANLFGVAKQKYEMALEVKPEDPYPQEQMTKIDIKLEELAVLERANRAYQDLIAEADQLSSGGQFDLAIAKYREAQALKSMENYPAERIEAIQTLMADAKKQREIEEKYQEQVLLATRLFTDDNLAQSRMAWQNALELKPFEMLPKTRMASIDSLVDARARQAEIDQEYLALIQSGDSLQNLKLYANALVVFEQASTVKPEDQVARQRIQSVKTIQINLEKEAARKKSYAESIAKADGLFEKENYELAKAAYEKALTFGANETYPKERIAEIDQLLVKLAAEREQRFKDAVASGSAKFDQGDYKNAVEDYRLAASIKPADAFVAGKISECESKIEEMMRAIMAEYNQAVAEADKLYAAKIYDKAISGYKKAESINPDETYPREMVDKITRYIEENAITDILNSSLTVQSKTTEKLTFDPVPVNVRKSNYIMVKAKSLTGKSASVIFSYGSDNGKNGGFVVTIPEGDLSQDFIIRVGNQYKWFSEDNNWIEIYPENGDIELTLVRISTSN